MKADSVSDVFDARSSRSFSRIFPAFPLLLCSFLGSFVSAESSALLRSGDALSGNETLISQNRTFAFGFFSPPYTGRFYAGIWYYGVTSRIYVWVANRDSPARDRAGAVRLTADGQLAVFGPDGGVLWQTENSQPASLAVLKDSGELVLLSSSRKAVWRSFNFPTDTWLPGMRIPYGKGLRAWRSPSDPGMGDFSLRLSPVGGNFGAPNVTGEFQLVWRDTQVYWHSGAWLDDHFQHVPEMTVKYIYNFSFVRPGSPTGFFVYSLLSAYSTVLSRFVVNSFGVLEQYTWSQQTNSWNRFWQKPDPVCGGVYGLCGPNGVCSDNQDVNYCRCLAGFVPTDMSSWSVSDWTKGCRRISPLRCETDKFYKVEDVGFVSKDPGKSFVVRGVGNVKDCNHLCSVNCSCAGFVYEMDYRDCRLFVGDFWNLRNNSDGDADEDEGAIVAMSVSGARDSSVLYVRVAACDVPKAAGSANKKKGKLGMLVGVSCGVGVFVILVAVNLFWLIRRSLIKESIDAINMSLLTMFTYKELQAATKNFVEKLGSGGFGTVYKGMLSGSIPIAVKKLERAEGGEKQFRMEVNTIGLIQHVNLVRLRGFCSEGERRLLVYDYMPNGSLNGYLFGEKQDVLNWKTRFRIAVGVAQAIAYLHEECRDCIVHCDIKPENILLDEEFNAKVSDFGLAKLIGRDFSRVLTTMRGTRGYLAPEWISGLPITAKADVYSFGMTLLEIIGGRRNFEKNNMESEKCFFPPWAARQVSHGNIMEVLDSRLLQENDEEEVRRAAMVAVWCIQDDEDARPTMGNIVKMLEGLVEVSSPPIPRTLQALVEENLVARTIITDSESSSWTTPCSNADVNASENFDGDSVH